MAKPVEERVKEIICEQLGVEEEEVTTTRFSLSTRGSAATGSL